MYEIKFSAKPKMFSIVLITHRSKIVETFKPQKSRWEKVSRIPADTEIEEIY
jgi:hypothetical protein